MSFYKIDIGRLGEETASRYLIENNFIIRDKNFRTRFAELDIIAQKDNKIHFIEVKTRVGTSHGKPYESINRRKIIHLKLASEYYLLKNHLKGYKLSLDVISIILTVDRNIESIKYFENIEG